MEFLKLSDAIIKWGISERTLFRRVKAGQIVKRGEHHETQYALADENTVVISDPGALETPDNFGIIYDGDKRRYSVKLPGRVRVNVDADRAELLLRATTHDSTAELLERVANSPAAHQRARMVAPDDMLPPAHVYVALTDVHVGQDEHGAEIAVATGSLLSQFRRLFAIGDVIIPVGSDLVHVDTYHRTTTKGTHIASALGARESQLQALQRMIAVTDTALDYGARVRLVYCPGNHDRVASYAVMLAMFAWYRNEPRVSATLDITERTYIQAGDCMVAVMHGDTHKVAEMPLTAATEAAELWGRCKHRFIMSGHRHHFLKGDAPGCTIIQARAAAPASEYDKLMGYHSPRAVQAFALGERLAMLTEPV
jgi:hypothetical protein